MAATAVASSGCRLVRNQGPFPFIQSEGGFVEPSSERIQIRNKPYVEKPNLVGKSQTPGESDGKTSNAPGPSPCSDVILSDYELEAIIRLRQQLDLQRLPIVPLGTRGKSTHEPPKRAEEPLKPQRQPSEQSAQTQDSRQQQHQQDPRQSQRSSATQALDPFTSPTWSAKMTPWDRLSTHHTLNSVRNHALMHRPFVIQSDLEFVLNSVFDQSRTMWADCAGVVVQPETVGLPTWKVFRNARVKQADEVISPSPYTPKTPPPGAPGGPMGAPLYGGPQTSLAAQQSPNAQAGNGVTLSGPPPPAIIIRTPKTSAQLSAQSLPKGDRDHPLRYGGIGEKLSPHSVKLAISGNHVSQTNAGYSRKVDGTFFS